MVAKGQALSLEMICWGLGAGRLSPHRCDVRSELGDAGLSPSAAPIMETELLIS